MPASSSALLLQLSYISWLHVCVGPCSFAEFPGFARCRHRQWQKSTTGRSSPSPHPTLMPILESVERLVDEGVGLGGREGTDGGRANDTVDEAAATGVDIARVIAADAVTKVVEYTIIKFELDALVDTVEVVLVEPDDTGLAETVATEDVSASSWPIPQTSTYQ